MMETLYRELFARRELTVAIRRARQELFRNKNRRAYFNQTIELEDWILPVVYQNRQQELIVREATPEEKAAHYEREAVRFPFPKPTYGFVGRDLDVLECEKRLLGRNLLLIRGLGGAGKTTLLRHLAAWWQTTNWVDRVFYFGYDQQAWTRQQILDGIARELLDEDDYSKVFRPMSEAAQQAMIAERLRARRHLLILDNLESITGAEMAIQNTLTPQEQEALKSLLAELADGLTLVLLGSRGGETWLAGGTFEDNVYLLGGLDPESASTLADEILARHDATKHRDDEDFKHVLGLLDGYPLALEVVLANLNPQTRGQTPAQVLDGLQAGDVKLDTPDAVEKTESIVRCIDYSHSNLSPEAQGLLACLAPFTGVIFRPLLEHYSERLRQQAAVAELPFDRWDEVLGEAADWGLLVEHPAAPGFLQLQPIFPYFLRSRLQTPEQAEVRRAVHAAFREVYDQFAGEIFGLLQSKQPAEKQAGQGIVRLEYENLATALDLALDAQVSILKPYGAISGYLDATQQQQRGLELGQTVLARLEEYPQQSLTGELGAEFGGVIDNIAMRQLLLKQYAAAEASYQKALSLSKRLRDSDQRQKATASVYHQLGYVAQAQRQWAQAEQHYQKALEISIEFNDRYSQASTYHQLGRVAEEQRQWAQAEQHYQKALEIYVEFNDRYEQAGTYHQLGSVREKQRQWAEAREYYLRALQTYVEYEDAHNLGIVLESLGWLWRAGGDAGLPAAVAELLGKTPQEMEALFAEAAGDDD